MRILLFPLILVVAGCGAAHILVQRNHPLDTQFVSLQTPSAPVSNAHAVRTIPEVKPVQPILHEQLAKADITPSISNLLGEFEIVGPTPADPKPVAPRKESAPKAAPVRTSDKWTDDTIPVLR